MARFFIGSGSFFLEGNPSGSGLERNGTIKSLLEAAALLARSRSSTSLPLSPSILSRFTASSSYTLLLTAPAQRILYPIGGLLPSRLNPNPQIPDADPAHLRSRGGSMRYSSLRSFRSSCSWIHETWCGCFWCSSGCGVCGTCDCVRITWRYFAHRFSEGRLV